MWLAGFGRFDDLWCFWAFTKGSADFYVEFLPNVYSPIEIDVEPSQVNDTGTPSMRRFSEQRWLNRYTKGQAWYDNYYDHPSAAWCLAAAWTFFEMTCQFYWKENMLFFVFDRAVLDDILLEQLVKEMFITPSSGAIRCSPSSMMSVCSKLRLCSFVIHGF